MANGIIVDPVGAGSDGTSAVVIPVSGSAGISGSGGVCFITAAEDAFGIDALKIAGAWGMMLLFIVLVSIRARFHR